MLIHAVVRHPPSEPLAEDFREPVPERQLYEHHGLVDEVLLADRREGFCEAQDVGRRRDVLIDVEVALAGQVDLVNRFLYVSQARFRVDRRVERRAHVEDTMALLRQLDRELLWPL